MTANLFASQMAIHDWTTRKIGMPKLDEWLSAGGSRESHVINEKTLASAKQYVAEVVRDLHTGERDELFEALFLRDGVQRQKDAKDGKNSPVVAKFCARFDSTKKSDLFRDFVARLVGM